MNRSSRVSPSVALALVSVSLGVAMAQAARRELAVAHPTLAVPGQRTELRYDLPRGRVVVRPSGAEARNGKLVLKGWSFTLTPSPSIPLTPAL